MSNRIILVMSVLSGLFLVLVGVLFPLAIPLEPRPPLLTAYLLNSRQAINFVYVMGVVLSNVLFSPLLVILTARLYRRRQATAIVAGSFMAFAIILETIAVLLSLARWSWVIPAAARDDPSALLAFDTFQLLWLMVDLPGAFLFYVAGAIYAIGLWRLHPTSSLLLSGSVVFFLAAGIVSIFSPAIGGAIVAGSIVTFGIAYIALGQLIIELGNAQPQPEIAREKTSTRAQVA